MIGADLLHDLTLTDYALILAAVGYAILKLMETTGRTKSSQILRRENEDLSRRNADLEHTSKRQSDQIKDLEGKVAVLESEMAELRKRDQAAVLSQLQQVEIKAAESHREVLEVLREIAKNTSPPVHVTQEEGGDR